LTYIIMVVAINKILARYSSKVINKMSFINRIQPLPTGINNFPREARPTHNISRLRIRGVGAVLI